MAPRSIFTIGIDLPDIEGLESYTIDSDQSLLDADIIVFRPSLGIFHSYSMTDYLGKKILPHSSSFQAMEKISHWTAQLRTAFESGKTIVVFLPPKEEMFRYTGEKTFSGTGRSRITTESVAPISNYDFLPVKFEELVFGQGRGMKLPRYVKDTGDQAFAESCRRAIADTAGDIVAFPKIPDST